MFSCMELKCLKSWLVVQIPWSQITKLSSTYLLFNLGFKFAELWVVISKWCIQMLDNIGIKEPPIGRPSFCL